MSGGLGIGRDERSQDALKEYVNTSYQWIADMAGLVHHCSLLHTSQFRSTLFWPAVCSAHSALRPLPEQNLRIKFSVI